MNRISNAHQVEEPDQFHGGVIADPMGFGKTLTMIALVAADTPVPLGLANEEFEDLMDVGVDSDDTASQTLIIVPPPRTSAPDSGIVLVFWLVSSDRMIQLIVLDTWEEQLSEYVCHPASHTQRPFLT